MPSKDIKKFKFVWGLLCTMSSVDLESNNISLFNVVDQFNIPAKLFNTKDLKNINYNHEIVTTWRRILDLSVSEDKINTDIKILIRDPEDKIITETVAPFVFPESKKSLRFRIQLPIINFNIPGSYIIEVAIKHENSSDFTIEGQIPFEIVKL